MNRFPVFLAALSCGAVLLASPQSTDNYGKACRFGADPCLSINAGSTATGSINPDGDTWVYVRFQAPSSSAGVSGFALELRTDPPVAVRIATALHGATPTSAGLAPGSVIRHGTETFVTGTMTWCKTWFANQPLVANATYFVAYRCPPGVRVRAGVRSGGTPVPWWTRAVGTSTYVDRTDVPIRLRVLCGGASPNIGAPAPPQLGHPFVVKVDDIPSLGSPTVFVYGFSNTSGSWGGFQPLPWDLSTIGMPQCDLLVDPAVSVIGSNSQPPGQSAESRVTLVIPALPFLSGLTFYGQWAVGAPGENPLGWVMSNAIRVTL